MALRFSPGQAASQLGVTLNNSYNLMNNPRGLVQELIWREFAVHLSVTAVGHTLKNLGLSAQRPLYRAWQADPHAVAAWKKEHYPAIAARARAAGATVHFVDEASVRSDYHAGTTWAPIG